MAELLNAEWFAALVGIITTNNYLLPISRFGCW
jgi:hypothetical protein